MDRHVAVKVIRTGIMSEPMIGDRFQREARLIARLEHPYLLPVYDFDGTHDPPYIVMRFLEGGTLKQVIERGGLPPDESLYTLRQVASALDYAHRQGVIHRDLKPSNIMIDLEGNAFITDFGIARVSDAARDLTGTGMALGTPGYMAPEQVWGESDVDGRADVYSLGAIIFEMLAGDPPFSPENVAGLLVAHLQEPVPEVTESNAAIPAEVNEVINKAMAKERNKRYGSAGKLVKALAEALKSETSGTPAQLRSMTRSFASEQLAVLAEGVDTESNGDTDTTPSDQQRQLTVLHVDLTELAEILYETEEPEDARETMDDLWNRLERVMLEHGGALQSRTAEVGLTLWGVEASREDDPERAIRAALAMKAAVIEASTGHWGEDDEPPPFKAGITTGPILLEQESTSGAFLASGMAITLAGRLKDAAPPGEILVAHDTFTHVRGVFTFQPLPPIRMRGRKEPLEVYIAVEAKPRPFRRPMRGVEGVETRMVGREAELKALQDALILTIEDRETQVVTVVGEAGVGKSRLLYEFSNWVDLLDEDIWHFQARAVQPARQQPYAVLRDLFSFRFRILDSDPPPMVRKKFVDGVVHFMGEDAIEKAQIFGQFISFDFSEIPAVQAALQEPKRFEEQARHYLGQFFSAAAQSNPVSIQIEDIHWADDPSLDLVNHLVRAKTDLPLFAACMARPELFERRPGWGEGQAYHARINLESLSRLDSRRLIREILKKMDKVPLELRDLIVERAEGNPFYVEELVKVLIDDRVIVKKRDKWTVDLSRLETDRIPPTLTGVLQARLDTLPADQRTLLQRASVIGRIFWDTAVVSLSETMGTTAGRVAALLDELHEKEMIFRREESAFERSSEYVFRHALLRDVTYETMLPRQRRVYHVQVAEWLIEASGERIDEYNILIAEHFQIAQEYVQAAEFFGKVAASAADRFALTEALANAQRADALMADVEDPQIGEIRLRHRLQLARIHRGKGDLRKAHELLESQLTEVRRYNDPRLAREMDDPQALMDVLLDLGLLGWQTGEVQENLPYLQEGLSLAQKMGDRRREGDAIMYLAFYNEPLGGELGTKLEYHRQVEAIGRELGDNSLILRSLNNLGYTHYHLGEYEKALQYFEEVMDKERDVGWDQGISYTACRLAMVCTELGRFEEARIYLHEGLQLGIETARLQTVLYGLLGHALLKLRSGQASAALELTGLAQSRPGFVETDHGKDVEHLVNALKGQMAEEEIQAAIQRGSELDFDEVIGKLVAAETENRPGFGDLGIVTEVRGPGFGDLGMSEPGGD
jgi:class 3 adenylate cyclase/tetratricopeptide (TPR) repeat protein